MADIDAAINAFIRDVIMLSRDDISSAADSREWFLTRVANVITERGGPTLCVDRPFVRYGSYFKGTKVSDVDEFDVLVVIDSNGGSFTNSNGGVIGIGQGTADPNYKYQGGASLVDGLGVSPRKVLEWLRSIVAEVADSYGGEAPERDGQAITVRIASKDLSIDLVPAGRFVAPNSERIFYDIPRGDAANGWILTAPEEDSDRLNAAAADRENFKNIIRIAKRIRDRYGLDLPSYAIEVAAIHYVQAAEWENQISNDLISFIRALSLAVESESILDPFDGATNLLANSTDLKNSAAKLNGIWIGILELYGETDQEKAAARVVEIIDNE